MQISSFKKYSLTTLLTVILLGLCYGYYVYSKAHPSTDNAYVQANTVYIAAQVSGPIVNLNVANHQQVVKDTVLFTIAPKPFELEVIKAQAQLQLMQQQLAANEAAVATAAAVVKQRISEYELGQKNSQRMLTLVKLGQLSKAAGDDIKGKLAVAKAALTAAHAQNEQAKQQRGEIGKNNAQLQAAQAALQQAQLNLQHTRVLAPAAGVINNLTSRVGSMVSAGAPLFALIEENQWWVDANFKETDIQRIKAGQLAHIELDSYPGKKFQGTVAAISAGSGAAFAILPPENATGNWVKVTQRFPIKILINHPDPLYPLRIGASCEVTIDTTAQTNTNK